VALPLPADKARFVRTMFDSIAARYDLMNRLMTGGRDEAWRRLAADAVYPETVGVALDVGAGTGDLSFALARLAKRGHVLALDFSEGMLRRGDEKRRRLGLAHRVQPALGDAMALPVPDDSVDAIVTGFTLRNVDDVSTVFREFYRALRPGGRVAVLELTRTTLPVFRDLFRFYFHRVVPLIGSVVSRRRYAYEYLPASVDRFPAAPELKDMLQQSGFKTVEYRLLALGTVALHVAEKGGSRKPFPLGEAARSAGEGVRRHVKGAAAHPHPPPAARVPGLPQGEGIEPHPAGGLRLKAGQLKREGNAGTLTQHEVTSCDEWTAILESLPNPQLLQSWEWGDIRRGTGWSPRRLVFERDGAAVAAASVLRRPIPYTGLGISYCPKGPILDYADAALFAETLRLLADDARRQRSIVLKVEPEVEAGAFGAERVLRGAGYVPAPERVQSNSTVLVDVRADDAGLMKPMGQTWRRYIRKAVRDGVSVREGSLDDVVQFYAVHRETADREGFIPRPLAYYERVFRLLHGAKLAGLFLAEVDGGPEAVLFAARYGSRAWYLYGGSTAKGQQVNAARLVQWHTMRWARDLGCATYDMWGAADDVDDASDPLHGVTNFKLGFGGRHVRWIGVYDYPAMPPLYGVWNTGLPLVRRGLRALRGERAAE
jgi:ubiquinone/menaquinone biosynthesis methyltransferase